MQLSARSAATILAAAFLGGVSVHAASVANSDSLLLREIAVSLGGANVTRFEGGRVVYLSIYYRGQRGPIPPALGGLDSLRHLHMAITGVTSLPREIGRLKRMDTIDIGSSSIGPTIPDEIGELTNLRCLKVHSCRLETLPVTLMKLENLETVDFSHNRICRVDDSLRQWILSKWPKALDYQDLSRCAPTGIGPRQAPPGGLPPSRITLLGSRWVPLKIVQADANTLYYTPLGRRLELGAKPRSER